MIFYFNLPAVQTRNEKIRVEEEEENLQPYKIPGTNIVVHHKFYPTMVDTKVRKVWSDVTTASTNCYLCGATPKQMGKPRGVLSDFEILPGALKYGGFGVHGYMRSFDLFCKCRFHFDFKLWSCM